MQVPYVPKNTFISNYMEYMADQETPVIYDFACACWILSNVLGRSVIVDRPRAPVYLNMYIILVSESGIMRKSTSIRLAASLLRQFYLETENKTKLIESKASQGLILDELHNSTLQSGAASAVFVASELAASFGRGAGVSSLAALLTDLYDCPDIRTGGGSIARGTANEITLRNVYLGFIAGTTPSWLQHAVTPVIIEGGFTSRCFFIVGNRRKRDIAWPDENTSAESQRRALIEQLKEIKNDSHNTSRMGVTEVGKHTFSNWYSKRIIHKDIYRESFESREDGHILRFAGLFAANERAWLIDDAHIRRAIEFVSAIKSDGASLFTGTSIRSTELTWLKGLRQYILKAGEAGVSKTDLGRLMHSRGMRKLEVQSMLHIMHELDLIDVREIQNGGVGRPRTMYYPTIYLQSEAFLDDVTRKLGMDQ